MRKVTKLWKQKNGMKIRICDMTDTHLENCIKLLERAAEHQKINYPYPMFNGEMAQYYAEQDYDRMQASGPEYFFPIYEDLCAERDRRALVKEKIKV
jgi:hypothetical protein